MLPVQDTLASSWDGDKLVLLDICKSTHFHTALYV